MVGGTTVERWAEKKGIAKLSFWALERDNGSCPGAPASESCSWYRPADLAVQPPLRTLYQPLT